MLCFDLQLSALELPPKKLFGNRDERMINERRGHLEVIKPVLKYPCVVLNLLDEF